MFFRVKDRELYYEIHGQGSPIVFCHGFGGNHTIWTGQLDSFAGEHELVTFDQAGHGQSTGSAAKSIRELIEDTASLIKAVGLCRPILVGHSMGASVVWGLIKYHPEIKARKIVTIDQSPDMMNSRDWPYGYLNINKDNYVKVLTDNKHVKETLNGIADNVWSVLGPFKKKHPFDREKSLTLLLDHVRRDWRPVAFATDVPALAVTSTKSPYFKFGYTKIMKDQNPSLQVATVDDTGHDIMAENPAEFNSILHRFLKE